MGGEGYVHDLGFFPLPDSLVYLAPRVSAEIGNKISFGQMYI